MHRYGHRRISIHAPREGGDPTAERDVTSKEISIHAPREGGDVIVIHILSRSQIISIHAPREGGDHVLIGVELQQQDFNPRPPRGGRLRNPCIDTATEEFQSTPPARGATDRGASYQCRRTISIHAPREGGDHLTLEKFCTTPHFNPRPPRGGRLNEPPSYRSLSKFQSTPPARGATMTAVTTVPKSLFQSTPPARGATSFFRPALGYH